jgi:hypothetical protein
MSPESSSTTHAMVTASDLRRRELVHRMAPLMFWLALGILFLTAIQIVCWVDIPRVAIEATVQNPTDPLGDEWNTFEIATDSRWVATARVVGLWNGIAILGLWVLFIVESVVTLIASAGCQTPQPWKAMRVLACCIPPVRMALPHPEMRGRLWLPGLGWRQPTRELHRFIESKLSVPMLVAALVMLPVLGVEFLLAKQIHEQDWLRLLLHVGTGLVWFAFAAEYILMLSLADRKLDYIKANLINLLIILLPFASFLRSLQALRATRLARLTRLGQLSKMIRMYRIRGVAMRLLRALLFLEVLTRLLTTPEKRRLSLRDQIARKEAELDDLRGQLAEIERMIASAEVALPPKAPHPDNG